MAVSFQNDIETDNRKSISENILKSKEFISAEGCITVPVGVTDVDELIVRDLSQIPHMLVCGQTGSGKTAFVSTLLSTIISRYSSQQVKMFIYDTKRVDYGHFNNAPHLMIPVVSDEDKALSLIKYISGECLVRLDRIAESGCRDIEKYNSQQIDDVYKMPELFCVIDDFEYLQLNKADYQELFSAIRNGRAVGVHIIIVSSMASTKAIQKELINMIPCKVCFRVSSGAESRAILGQSGAEELFIPGEMIYKYQNDLYRCQCAYASYENIEVVVKNVFQSEVSVKSIGVEASNLFDDDNEKYSEKEKSHDADMIYMEEPYLLPCALLCIENEKGSVGMLQRNFKIGFNRAARIMDRLEELGVVGPEEGTKPRKVLMSIDDWHNNNFDVNPDFHRITENNKIRENNRKNVADTKDLDAQEQEQVHEYNVKLRNLGTITVGEESFSVNNNLITIHKKINTTQGPGYVDASFEGSNICGLILKKPTLFSKGYFKMEFNQDINIKNNESYLLYADQDNISDLLKIDFDSGHYKTIKSFVEQLSIDTGVSITYV